MQKQLQVHEWLYTFMKISLLQILLAVAFFSMAYAESSLAQGVLEKKISIDVQNSTLRDVLVKLEELSEARFMYHSQLVSGKSNISLEARNESLADVLDKLLTPYKIGFEATGNQIVLTREEAEKTAQAENQAGTATPEVVITGTVIDESGGPMPGVNVMLKGTTIGTSTNVEGKYSLTIPELSGTLLFSFIGYMTEEYVIDNRTVIDIRMIPDISTLSEVVVVGYGTVKKRDLTGSVYSLKKDEILQTPTHNAVESMQGRVPGVDIVRASGAPGASTNIVVRGNRTLGNNSAPNGASNAPLYVIDGIQIPQGSDISNLSPNDIESIEVLKDASATAIYGAMGANGVVIVTTKRGAEGKTKVSYNAYYGINTYSYPDARTGESYLKLREDGAIALGRPTDIASLFPNIQERAAVNAGQFVNWVDLLKHTGTQESHSISLSSGTENTKIFASGNYFNERGMLERSNYTRYNGRFNLDQTISKLAKVGLLNQITYSITNARKDPMTQALTFVPLGVPYDSLGKANTYPLVGDNTRISPLADERSPYVARNNTLYTELQTNAFLELTPIKGLRFRSNLGVLLSFKKQGIYNDKLSLDRGGSSSYALSQNANERTFNWDNILEYTMAMEDHNLTIMGLTSYIQDDKDITTASGTGQISGRQLYYALDGSTPSSIASPYAGWKNMAFAGRVNYNYQGKYLVTVSGRYDGASRLSPGHKWNFFPSVALGWNIMDEAFLSDVKTFTNLKLRASYGEAGNYSIAVYGTQNALTASRRMSFGEIAAPIYNFNTTLGNPDLGWETSATTNIGLDIGVLESKLNASIDVYQTITSDILMSRKLPPSNGLGTAGTFYQNNGETQNKGIEITITSKNISTDNFTWNTTLTFTKNKEEITRLIGNQDLISGETNSYMIGHPIKSFYNYKKLGIWQTSEADEAQSYRFTSATGPQFTPGTIKLKDMNDDNIIDPTHDRGYIGSTVPTWSAGLLNTFTYRGFDLSVFMLARWGQMIEAAFLGRYNPDGTGNGPGIIDYWTPDHPTNAFPQPKQGVQLASYAGYQSLRFVDGSYYKVKNITLGYTLPSAVSERISLNRVRIYATASNPFVKAKSSLIKDYDPEGGGAEASPLSKTFVMGINVDF